MNEIVLVLMVSVLLLWTMVLAAFAQPLLARWREPVLRDPVLVLESDDWGAGPLAQATALVGILDLLRAFRDESGRPPVMTLGMVFEVPDTARIAAENGARYYARGLDDACFRELRDVIAAGIREGVFAPQLHGQSHYWPAAVLRAARADAAVKGWLTQSGLPRTEDLPAPLQSRWVDASQLPSRALARDEIERAVASEVQMFREHFGLSPYVAVATTFVWNDDVERAWHRHGVEAIIAPGKRYTVRDAHGNPGGSDRAMILTGEHADAGACYVVRDAYFEPALGHAPERLVGALRERTHKGRACLVEIHRFNFLDAADSSLAALGDALRDALNAYPHLRFMSSQELAQAIKASDARLLDLSFGGRARAWIARVGEIPRFSRLARVTGLMLPLVVAARAV